jgi:hypothetical protein
MRKFYLVALTLGFHLFSFVLAPSHSGILAPLQVAVAPCGSVTPVNTAAGYGVALLNINGATQNPALSLGGVEAGAFGNYVYLAVNDLAGGPGASRMIKFPSPGLADLNHNEDGIEGTVDDGLVVEATATSEAGAESYLINSDLAGGPDNPNDHSGDYILGMTVDTSSNDIHAVVRDGAASMAIMRLSQGDTQVQNVIEFAAPTTMPQPLSPGYSPFFADVMMGPESVVYFRNENNPDLFYFTDGTTNDFCMGWALEDLAFERIESGGVVIDTSTPDTNFFTDEMRVHANVIASSRAFNAASPHIHSDAVLVNGFDTIAFCTGRTLDESLFIVDDLDDNADEDIFGDDPDIPQVDTVIDNRTPTALCNVFDVDEFDRNRDILMADYDSGTDTTQIVKVHFDTKTTVTETVLDLSTLDSALPGRITGLAMDINGNIYAVDGAGGCVFLIRGRIDIEIPAPDPSFACFQVSIGGNFTMPQLVASVNAEATNVVTELKLVEDGNLDAFLPDGAADIRRFYYFHQPVTIPTGNHLIVDNGDVLIFRCDGADRAYLDVFGQIRTVADDPASFIGVGDIISDVVEEGQVRYTSVIGFISWLKSRGVASFSDLGWSVPAEDGAALGFQAFANRLAPFSGQSIFDTVHDSTSGCLLVSCVNPPPTDPPVFYQDIVDRRIRTVNDEIAMNWYGTGVGRWGGIWFGDSEIGNGPDTASSIQHSVVEFAEAGVYDMDDVLSTSSPRDEDHLRIVNNEFYGNLIGISIDGPSPLVARNSIRYCAVEAAFDNRIFGGSNGATPFVNPCTLNRLTRRFVVGDSGTGVFITKRDPGPLSSNPTQTEPLFYSNRISDNAKAGVIVQQPGLEGFPGTSTDSRVPKPLFGSVKIPAKTAHEFTNSGRNNFFNNGIPGLRKNFIYRVEEFPNDAGVASIDHERDIEAQFCYWGEQTTAGILSTLIDGRGTGSTDYGEVVVENAVATELTSVEGSTDLYK